MKVWLLTPEYGRPFIVKADTAEEAIQNSNIDILYIHEHDIFSILREDTAISGLDYLEAAQ